MSVCRKTYPEFAGHYDLVYSPDDGGWYILMLETDRTSPTYATAEKAHAWAKKHGGVTEHRP